MLILFTTIGLGALTLAWFSSRPGGHNTMDQADTDIPQISASLNSAGINPGGPELTSTTNLVNSLAPCIPTVEGSRPEAEPITHARQLVENLSKPYRQGGTRAPDMVPEWNRQLEELTELGTAAVPALQDFFRSQADVRLDSNPGALPSGATTLRREFIKVLFNIPDPDNVELQSLLLQTTADPGEIALLATQLELQQPGIHREQILSAAKTALEREKENPQGVDTRPLLAIVEEYGDASVK